MEFKNCHRTHNFSEITEKIVGEKIKVAGWIETIRDHGGLVFIDLRYRTKRTFLSNNNGIDTTLETRVDNDLEYIIEVNILF